MEMNTIVEVRYLQ